MLFPAPPQLNSASRVVITGAGIITGLGCGWRTNADGFRAGKRAFRPVSLFDVSRQRVKVAAEVDLPKGLPTCEVQPKAAGRLDRAARLLLWAGQEAWAQAGWSGADDLPLVLGTTSGGMTLGEDLYRQAIAARVSKRKQATRVIFYQAHRQALELATTLGFMGPITIVANACASGTNAVGHAFELVRSGRAQRVLTGGYEALSQLVFGGFDSLQALSPTQCRPFDATRDGLALGEGAAVMALESFTSAHARGAEILGEITGYGAVNDCHHLTQPHPEGDAAWAAMSAALAQARLRPEQIGYINAHGTGTALNDSAEAAAINRWAGRDAAKVPVSSTKACIGHLLGAAGAVEAVICLMALREQWLPPMPMVQTPDPLCRFPLVQEPTEARVQYALSNSFGFGGANATLILRRWS